jgi:hypothetical protein
MIYHVMSIQTRKSLSSRARDENSRRKRSSVSFNLKQKFHSMGIENKCSYLLFNSAISCLCRSLIILIS